MDETIYMTQSKGFEKKEKLVCLVNKSLYCIKQTTRQWYKIFNAFIQGLEFNKFECDPCFYFKRDSKYESYYLLL